MGTATHCASSKLLLKPKRHQVGLQNAAVDSGNAVPLVVTDRTTGRGLELHQGRSQLDKRNNSFSKRAVQPWDRLPRAAAETSSPEGLNSSVDVVRDMA